MKKGNYSFVVGVCTSKCRIKSFNDAENFCTWKALEWQQKSDEGKSCCSKYLRRKHFCAIEQQLEAKKERERT
jgi:hypothetical protein